MHTRPHPRLEQPVRSEGEGNTQTQPRNLPVHHAHNQYRHGRNPDGDPLNFSQPLVQEHDPQHHGDQRVNKIPQRHINRMPVRGGIHIDHPVRADQQRRDRQNTHSARSTHRLVKRLGQPENREQNRAECQ